MKSARDTATKRRIATFSGDHHIAERQGNDLHIYQLLDEFGNPAAVEGTADAAAPKTIRSLSDLNAAWAARPHGNQRRA
jgi:hypothetical protein